MSLHSLLIHTCDIETETQTKTPTGGVTKAWATKASGVPCRVDKMPEKAAEQYGKFDVTKLVRVYLDTDQALTIKDRISYAGGYFYVISVVNAGGHLNRLWQIDCEKKPGGQ